MVGAPLNTQYHPSVIPQWMVDAAPFGHVVIDEDARIVFINKTMLDWTGLHRNAAELNLNLMSLLSSASRVYMQTCLMPQILLTGSFEEAAVSLRRTDGTKRKALVVGRRINESGEIILAFSCANQRVRMDEDLAQLRDVAQIRLTWLDQIERTAAIGAWAVDIGMGSMMWSDQAFAIHDMDVGVMPSWGALVGLYPDIDLFNALSLVKSTDKPFELNTVLRTKACLKQVRIRGQVEWEMRQPRRILGIIEDITAQAAVSQALWRSAHIDELSNLLNRRFFGTELMKRLADAGRDSSALTLLMVDLDHFKEVNDMYGHAAGNAVIRIIADRISAALPPQALIGRLGGDEFAIAICHSADDNSATDLVNDLLALLRETVILNDEEFALSASIGFARCPDHGMTPDTLMRAADMALIEAKRTRKGGALFYNADIGQSAEDRRVAINRVRQAAALNRITAHYQPRIKLRTGHVCGYEALARITEDDGSLSGPSVWGAALDDPTCARLVDEHVMRAVIRDWPRLMKGREAVEPDVKWVVSVNRSEHSIRRDDFVPELLTMLAANDIPPTAIEVEVLEAVLVQDVGRRLSEQLALLRAAGASVALDDFGTGYASLMHLEGLPIDRIKLDRSVLQELHNSARARAIVSAMISLAHALGIGVVAEGIETEAAWNFLNLAGCGEGQGYLFGSPTAV